MLYQIPQKGGSFLKQRIFAVFLALLLIPVLSPQPLHAQAVSCSAEACVLIEATTGKILFEKNSATKRPMASTTKIMTTLLCLESGGLDDPFIVDSEAIHVEGSSMGLQEGDIVTKRALCYGMMLPSGNDAANAVAVRLASSQPAFAEQMNTRAAKIGMTNTCFVTPSGLEGEGHGASALDMALLTREALKNEDFRAICSQPSAKVAFGDPPYERTLKNTNKLLTSCEGVIGVKTGFTDEAGRCLVSACTRNDVTLICVTLKAPDDWNDHRTLYDYGFSRVTRQEVALPQGMTLPVVGGTTEEITLRTDTIPVVGADSTEIDFTLLAPPFVYAPIRQGEAVAELQLSYHGRVVDILPLYAAEQVEAIQIQTEPSSLWERLRHFFANLF
ncbi:MAG: D-alanyl-D-alanine carboxypeptidase [Ruminococcus sp.]|nr:D-alanyl-D-alanine carboxypeptidase [Ruminococcus sp.]